MPPPKKEVPRPVERKTLLCAGQTRAKAGRPVRAKPGQGARSTCQGLSSGNKSEGRLRRAAGALWWRGAVLQAGQAALVCRVIAKEGSQEGFDPETMLIAGAA